MDGFLGNECHMSHVDLYEQVQGQCFRDICWPLICRQLINAFKTEQSSKSSWLLRTISGRPKMIWFSFIVGNITFFLRPNAIQCTVISNLLNILEASLADHPAINWASPTGHPQSAGFSLLWPHGLLGHLNGTFLFCLHKCGDVNMRPRYLILFRTGQT